MYLRIAFLISILCFTGCFKHCDYDQQLKSVKSLSNEQLKDVFEAIENYSYTLKNEYTNNIDGTSFKIPHLNYIVGGISKKRTYLKIGGCMDDKAIVNVRGYGELSNETNSPLITVAWEEGPYFQKVELWKEK